jgi:Anti-sigma-K factor rskA/Putative zinc-finger
VRSEHENVAPYVLGSLEEAEAREFERHLDRCADCRAELERLRPAVDVLAESVDPVAPSPDLKRELMRRVREEGAPESVAPGRSRLRAGAALRGRVHMPPLGGFAGRLRPALAVAAAALAALGGVVGYGLGRDDDRGRRVAASVDRARLGAAAASLTLPGEEAEPAILRVRGLRLPAPGRAYEAWVLRGGRPVPAAVFTVRADGTGEVAVPGDLAGAEAVLVTRERNGGAVAPSERPVMTFRLD